MRTTPKIVIPKVHKMSCPPPLTVLTPITLTIRLTMDVTLQVSENYSDLQQNSPFLKVRFCSKRVLIKAAKAENTKAMMCPIAEVKRKKAET